MAAKSILPTISIVVPVYSGAKTLAELASRCAELKSVHPDDGLDPIKDLIFVCDEPIDDSIDVIHNLEKAFPWIRVVQLARNSGQHLATAVGMMISSSDWVLTIDEDLQHPPEVIYEALHCALSLSADVVYIRSSSVVHRGSFYRDITSCVSKKTLRLLTKQEYADISSFRLVRGEIARVVGHTLDRHSYLDATLFAATSRRRRTVLRSSFADTRTEQSGYHLSNLLRHYGRLISSAELSGLQLLSSLFLAFMVPIIMIVSIYLLSALVHSVQAVAPGWLSLFTMILALGLLVMSMGAYTLKLLSVLISRSGGLPPFMVVDRSLDQLHFNSLQELGYFRDLSCHR